MKLHRIIDIVRERLVDELVKEMLKDRYAIVSACYKEKDGRKILPAVFQRTRTNRTRQRPRFAKHTNMLREAIC